ncbi:hydroxyacylglutathione hydrolase [Acrasis kona]|uniref:hydroxyacylglutathione hydrolase n=1 Tax=Acrasis kona TaxID=1008807 RepID=A0AAW2ZLD3_9EUKA
MGVWFFLLIIFSLFALLIKSSKARIFLFSNVIRPIGYRLYLFEFIGMFFHRLMLKNTKEERESKPLLYHKMGYLGSQDDAIEIIGLPFLTDNYCYIILYKVKYQDVEVTKAVAVDPADHELLTSFLDRSDINATLSTILTTHKHWDHAGGNVELKNKYPEAVIVGSTIDKVAACTKFVNDKDEFTIDGILNVRIVLTPCHTAGHIMFVVSKKSNPNQKDAIVFSGDHLFVGGCGALFEGNMKEMKNSMNKIKQEVDWDSRIFCGHEYSTRLLQVAQRVEPDNQEAKLKYNWAMRQRYNKLPTVPTTLRQEVTYNPFLREAIYTMM